MDLYGLPKKVPKDEVVEEIIKTSAFRVERILSAGQASPQGFWFDQEEDEWVCLLQGTATIEFDDGTQKKLHKGDELFLPAHCRHRVADTSSEPPCIWLCVFGKTTI